MGIENELNSIKKEDIINNYELIKKQISVYIKDFLFSKDLIISKINNSFQDISIKNDNKINKLKNDIISDIRKIFEEKERQIKNILSNKEIEINYNEPKNLITSRDIQNKIGEIAREFQEYSTNFLNDEDDNIERNNLLNIANISRYTYNQSNKFLNQLYEQFEKEIKIEKIVISSPDEIRIQFHKWIKEDKNENFENLKKKYLKEVPKDYIKNFKDYTKKLYENLFELYYSCPLSFPEVEIKFLKENEIEFDSKKMINIFDNSTKPKNVYFDYFPSFFSNNNYLEYGKHWVYTYGKNEKIKYQNVELLKLGNIFNFPKLAEKITFNIKKYIKPIPNFKIKQDINYEFIFHIEDQNKKSITKTSNSYSYIEIENGQKLVRCDFKLMNKFIESIYY